MATGGSTGTDTIKAEVLSKDSANWFVFATRKVTLRLDSPDTLAYQVKTDFADSSRQDYVVSGHLRRS